MRAKKASAAVLKTPAPAPLDDTAMRALNQEDRSKLDIDSWEPSLLRHMLAAQDKLPKKR